MDGLETFFRPGARSSSPTPPTTCSRTSTARRRRRAEIGGAARARVLARDTAEHRADELVAHVHELQSTGDRT
jgi:hypothetical protein